jgi:hypothetical protein
MILERIVEKVKPDKWDDYVAIVRQIDEAFARLGRPPARRYQILVGGDTFIEMHLREWESLAAMEAPREGDPELGLLLEKAMTYIESHEVVLFRAL